MSHTLFDTTQAAFAIAAAFDQAFPPSLAEKLDSFHTALAFIEQEQNVDLNPFREMLDGLEEDDEEVGDGSQAITTPSTPFCRADDFAMLPPEVRAEIAQRAVSLIQSVGIVH